MDARACVGLRVAGGSERPGGGWERVWFSAVYFGGLSNRDANRGAQIYMYSIFFYSFFSWLSSLKDILSLFRPSRSPGEVTICL